MENASDALIMAFAVIIFVVALTVAINAFSQAREVSELVLYTADETNYYTYEDVAEGASQSRIVGLETIIPTLYGCYKENYSVLFLKGDYIDGRIQNAELMKLYTSPSQFANGNSHSWARSGDEYYKKLSEKYSGKFVSNSKFDDFMGSLKNKISSYKFDYRVFSFDFEEEYLRHEPWSGFEDQEKKNMECFLNGGTYTLASDGSDYIDYSKSFPKGSFIKEFTGKRFVENVAEIKYTSDVKQNEDDDERERVIVDTSRTNKGKKRIYIFTLID